MKFSLGIGGSVLLGLTLGWNNTLVALGVAVGFFCLYVGLLEAIEESTARKEHRITDHTPGRESA